MILETERKNSYPTAMAPGPHPTGFGRQTPHLLNVGVAAMRVSGDPGARIATHALGSCIALILFDPAARVGGLLHFMLPESSLNPEKARANPFVFADTGIPRLFRAAYRLGAQKKRIRVLMVGGARQIDRRGIFDIGRRNADAAGRILRANGVAISHSRVGGAYSRSVSLSIASGDASFRWLPPMAEGPARRRRPAALPPTPQTR